jgi:hypothetical protein
VYQRAFQLKLSFVSSISVSGNFDVNASESKLAPSHVDVLLWNYPSSGATLNTALDTALNKDVFNFTFISKQQVIFYHFFFLIL